MSKETKAVEKTVNMDPLPNVESFMPRTVQQVSVADKIAPTELEQVLLEQKRQVRPCCTPLCPGLSWAARRTHAAATEGCEPQCDT